MTKEPQKPSQNKSKKPKVKPKRPYMSVIRSLKQVLKINRDISVPIWLSGEAEHEQWGEWPLRLTIWNIFKGSGGEHFYNDFRLLSFQSDILMIQEALLSRRSLHDLSPKGFYGVHGASYERADRLRDGVMTLSRMEPDRPPLRILCKYPEPVLKTPKVALVTIYRLGPQRPHLMVVNLHATLIRSIKRAQEELDHIIEQLPEHPGPIIFAGDFNTFTPRYFQAISQRLESLGLRYVPIPEDPRGSLDHLDQLFIRGLDVTDVHIDVRIQSSDHFPIRATIRLPTQA